MPTIALVDDDSNILTSVSMALEAEGYRKKALGIEFPATLIATADEVIESRTHR